MPMRVVGGIYRGRRLVSFKGLSIRPTSDRVRESVFNILVSGCGGCFPFKKTLDLFAGTGAMGIEAISRGAQSAVFVDSDKAAAAVIEKNLSALGISTSTVFSVFRKNVSDAVRVLSGRHSLFDLVFIDPPYGAGLAMGTLADLDTSGIVAEGGTVVVETSRRAPVLAQQLKNLELIDERRYGDTLVYFFTCRKGR